jgi:hypothetical protein
MQPLVANVVTTVARAIARRGEAVTPEFMIISRKFRSLEEHPS